MAILTPDSLCSYVAFQDIAGTSSLDMTFKGSFGSSYPCTSTFPSKPFLIRALMRVLGCFESINLSHLLLRLFLYLNGK